MALRFSAGSQKVVLEAQEEARNFHHDYVGTEHLLLAMASCKGELCAQILKEANITPAKIKREIEKLVGLGDNLNFRPYTFYAACKKHFGKVF